MYPLQTWTFIFSENEILSKEAIKCSAAFPFNVPFWKWIFSTYYTHNKIWKESENYDYYFKILLGVDDRSH